MPSDPEQSLLDYLKALPRRLLEEKAAPSLASDTPESPLLANLDEETPSQTGKKSGVPAATWLFLAGMLIYLITRLGGLADFPIYFFSDEAIQTLTAKDLLANGFRGPTGQLLPLYFNNGGQLNLSLSVYLQLLTAWLPNQVGTTRLLPALLSLVVPVAVAFSLKRHFKARFWWLAPFFVSAIPAWFLHSRTAFETSQGTSFFALFIFFYLEYRVRDPRKLPFALLFGAMAFYSYAPMQFIIVLSGLLLLFVDLRYHRQQGKRVWISLAVLALLAAPYLVFRLRNAAALSDHLRLLNSYWLSQETFTRKVFMFLERWLKGLDPTYWFRPNAADLARHRMQGYAHLGTLHLPFAVAGIVIAIRRFKEPAYRTLLLLLIAAPAGAALVDPSITRLLPAVVPFALLIGIGLDALLNWLGERFSNRALLGLAAAGILALSSLWMYADARSNGPEWFTGYGLYGMQWGREELFKAVREEKVRIPERQVVLSPNWANATDLIARFFLGDPLPITVDSLKAWDLYYKPPLDAYTLFVLTPEEYDWMLTNPKFTESNVIRTVSWPDGRTGFFFVTLRYSDLAQTIFEQESAARSQPQTSTLHLFGQQVSAIYSPLDIGVIEAGFDANRNTLIRGFEANPLEIRLVFPEPVTLQTVTAWVGAPETVMTVEAHTTDDAVKAFSARVDPSEVVREISVDFGQPLTIKTLVIAISNVGELEPAHVHIWDIDLR